MKASFKIMSVFWLILVVVCFGVITKYSMTAGKQSTGARAPASSTLIKRETAQLFVFLHPKCSCSLATLAELKNMIPDLGGIPVTLVFFGVQGKEWKRDELWKKSGELKVTRLHDENGTETKLFGAQTSGHTVLVDANQRIVFSGGITPARGHIGDSEGKSFVLRWAKFRDNSNLISKIFGCNLFKDTI